MYEGNNNTDSDLRDVMLVDNYLIWKSVLSIRFHGALAAHRVKSPGHCGIKYPFEARSMYGLNDILTC